ncbi:hypothetical protein [Streptomyces sp. NPDC017940]|uniref:hypothetical protein n=1 Tax=Streptomyces sp. NPDC017940 TaxID=3365017 RepID=UPI0037B8AAC9
MGPPVADEDGAGDEPGGLDRELGQGRREVLAARGDDEVLLAAGDAQIAVLVERAEVARVQPALVVEGGAGGGLVGVIAGEDVGTAGKEW